MRKRTAQIISLHENKVSIVVNVRNRIKLLGTIRRGS